MPGFEQPQEMLAMVQCLHCITDGSGFQFAELLKAHKWVQLAKMLSIFRQDEQWHIDHRLIVNLPDDLNNFLGDETHAQNIQLLRVCELDGEVVCSVALSVSCTVQFLAILPTLLCSCPLPFMQICTNSFARPY